MLVLSLVHNSESSCSRSKFHIFNAIGTSNEKYAPKPIQGRKYKPMLPNLYSSFHELAIVKQIYIFKNRKRRVQYFILVENFKLINVSKDKILAKVRDCFSRYTGCWLVNMLHVKVRWIVVNYSSSKVCRRI